MDIAAKAVEIERSRARPIRPALVLAATILGSSLSFIDGSVINVGLPTIGGDLHGSAADLQWIIDGYLLPLSALVLFGGALGDRFGRGRLFGLGIILFAAASGICAVAPSPAWLIAARMMQGAGAALLSPNSLAILNDAFQGPARGRAIGFWAAAGAATSGLGPVLGGWIIDAIGWRFIFVMNLPLAAAALLLAWWSGTIRTVPGRQASIDLVGALLATFGLGALTFGLIMGGAPSAWSPLALAGIGAGAIGLASFLLWEQRRGDNAMMPLHLFTSRDFAALTGLTLFLYAALGALMVLLPYGMMKAGHASAVEAGAALLPITVLLATFSSLFGGVSERFGPRPVLVAGCTLVAAGFVLILRVGADSSYATGLLPALVVIGLGLAVAVAPLTAAVMASVEPRMTGTASGFNNATARTAGLIATACLGRVLATSGDELIQACHAAAVVAAIACLVAAASGLLVRKARSER